MTAIHAPATRLRRRRQRIDTDPAITSRRELDQVLTVVEALAEGDRAGLSLLALAEATRLPMGDLLRLLKRHGDYFVACGDTGKVRLNRFGPFRGEPEAITRDAGARLRQFRGWALVAAASLIASLVASLPAFGG